MNGRRIERRGFLKAFGFGAVTAASVSTAHATPQENGLSNKYFRVSIDKANGSITEISNPSDPFATNWLSATDNAPWQMRSVQWGMGFADLGSGYLHRGRWDAPKSVILTKDTAKLTYELGPLKLEVSRSLEGEVFKERYAFTNTGSTPLDISRRDHMGAAIYVPFNDHYTSSADVLRNRCHAHIWAGGTSSWVAAFRMGGEGAHLGLVLTEGYLAGYGNSGRDQVTSSNTRGTFLLHPSLQLAPGETKAVAWTIFWHSGWDDFFAKCARYSSAFVQFDASPYTAYVGETIQFAVKGADTSSGELRLTNTTVPFSNGKGQFTPSKPGEITARLIAPNGRDAFVRMNVVPKLDDLIKARINYIVDRQQVNDPTDERDGAFVVYDTAANVQVLFDSMSDRNEARERLGMGVLLAQWLRMHSDKTPRLRAALDRYYTFISTKIQRPDGFVKNGVKSDRERLYNWPWVAVFYLEYARLTSAKEAYAAFVKTIENFYAHGGAEFYPIQLPVYDGVRALRAAGLAADAQRVLDLFIRHGDRISTRGIHYPTSEVNYEQSIVGPAAAILVELHRITGDKKWLTAAKPNVELLSLFNGRQPDHHMNDVAIRHWDAYWFGKFKTWGDTFPHYWSAITAGVFHHYAIATGQNEWAVRADNIIRNNLSLFTADGKGFAAFVYPLTVNGGQGHFSDPYANDQDWALVYALQIRDDPRP
ncbi:hypothetical protein PQU92_16100 [Asticcacaulis sp. BYS171W]|uniref:Tat pathway signal sequence domain protein n=1 Tax=Asticcacaulis aquaticus TaxID=2984212 RepID=A0ABT5HXL0_9CAUL|nr:hypothetical protein [Asticcacaulis aquaticus]MDC7684807.1 hypothetical protein [Asticcacaulis aquaticus]